jgi:hypothetical protein
LKIKEEKLWLWEERKTFMTKANVILLGLTLTNNLAGHVMDIREVQATHLVNLPTMGGFFTNHQITMVGHLKGCSNHKVQSSQGQIIAIYYGSEGHLECECNIKAMIDHMKDLAF